jgi:hypothetical protein
MLHSLGKVTEMPGAHLADRYADASEFACAARGVTSTALEGVPVPAELLALTVQA